MKKQLRGQTQRTDSETEKKPLRSGESERRLIFLQTITLLSYFYNGCNACNGCTGSRQSVAVISQPILVSLCIRQNLTISHIPGYLLMTRIQTICYRIQSRSATQIPIARVSEGSQMFAKRVINSLI